MKTSTVGIVTQINKETLKELLTETKETLATDMLNNRKESPAFGAIDLWKVRKNSRMAASFRRYF